VGIQSCSSGTGNCIVDFGSIAVLFATITSNTSFGSSPATGTITFYTNGTLFGSPVAVDDGENPPYVSLSTNQLPLGQYSLTAAYSGDANYAPSTSPANLIDVVIQTSSTLNESSTAIQPGQSVTFTDVVTPITNQSII
jgi:hypothetical protein